MKIAFISYWSCPLTKLGVLNAGGMNIYVLYLANALGSLGNEVDIYTRVHHGSDEQILSIHKNVRIIHLTGNLKNKEDLKDFGIKMTNFIKRNNLTYDTLHSHYYNSGKIGLELKKMFHIPLLHTFHTLGILKYLYLGIKDKKRIDIEKDVVKNADIIIASTNLEQKDLIKNYLCKKEKIKVISPGIDHKKFKPKLKLPARKKLHLAGSKKIILFVGRIDPVKGLQFLIESIYLLTRKYPEFVNKYRVLLIGGDIRSKNFWQNDEVKKIRHLIAERGLECCVKFIGNQPHYLLPDYYNASDVVVMPSLYESFGFVVLEALACGACVLASRVGGLAYLIKDKVNGRLFKSGNIKELGSVLWELLHDNKQRDRLGKNAIKYSADYCWDKQADKILKIYRKLI